MKALKDQCALLSDNPGLYQAVVVLEEETMTSPAFGAPKTTGIRPVIFMGDLETAERIVSCWNTQLGVPTKDISRKEAPKLLEEMQAILDAHERSKP